MLSHLSIAVSDLDKSAAFYDETLAALGYVATWRVADAVGYGARGGNDKFAIKFRGGAVTPPSAGTHIAFHAPNRQAVDAFYRAALALGGRDNGPPGLRRQYGPDYYAAFVIDPDGYCLEAKA